MPPASAPQLPLNECMNRIRRACCAPPHRTATFGTGLASFCLPVLAPISLLPSIPFFPCTPPPFSALTTSSPFGTNSGRRRWTEPVTSP